MARGRGFCRDSQCSRPAFRNAHTAIATGFLLIGLTVSGDCLADDCALLKQQMAATIDAEKKDAGVEEQQQLDYQAYQVAQKAWIDTCVKADRLPGGGRSLSPSAKLNALSDLQNLIDEQSQEQASVQAAQEAEIERQRNQELARQQMLQYFQAKAAAEAKARDDARRKDLPDPFNPSAPAPPPDPNNPFSSAYQGP